LESGRRAQDKSCGASLKFSIRNARSINRLFRTRSAFLSISSFPSLHDREINQIMMEEQVKVKKMGEEEDASSVPTATEAEDDRSPETSPTQKAARRAKKDLYAFLEKGGSSNQNSLTDVTEHTLETTMTVETEIWYTANKIIEDRLAAERKEDRRRLDKVVQHYKHKRDKLRAELKLVREEKNQLATECDNLKMALEEEKKNGEKTLSVHRRALERNDRMQTSADILRQRIEKLETERFGWVDERSKLMCTLFDLQAQQRQKKNKLSPTRSLESIPEDATSKETSLQVDHMKEDQKMTREAILASQLEEVTKRFEFQGKLLKMKNGELASMEATKQKLSDEMDAMSKKLKSNNKTVMDMQKDLQKAKDSRRPVLDENKALKQEIGRLHEMIGSFSEQVTLQKAIVKKVKDHIHEGTAMHQMQADELLNVCREFEGSCKKFSNLQVNAVKPARNPSKHNQGAHRSSGKKSCTEKAPKSAKELQRKRPSDETTRATVSIPTGGLRSDRIYQSD
jgi:hypothetical protein